MAIKPPDLLSRLPSVSELLDNPPIRALVDRWNRSAVAGGVRSFLDEVRTDLERRAGELPSIRELAERAARYVVSRQHSALGIAINATGRLGGSNWTSTPMAEIALERMIALGREYAADKPADVEPLLCRLTGAEAAVAVNSYGTAVWLVLMSLADRREVLVARAEAGEVDAGCSLIKLAMAAGATVKEVGATNRSAASDYEAAVTPQTSLILTLSSDTYRIVGESTTADFDELVAIARERELRLVDALGGAPLIEPPPTINWPRRSVAASLARGASLVVLRGDGLVGGPASGLLLGCRDMIQQITNHPLYALATLDPLRSASLLATLECYDSPSRGADTLPLWQCLTTSVENLRNRAERLAAQLGHVSGVASATSVETRSPLTEDFANGGWPSYGVALAAADGDIGALVSRLRGARFPIVGRAEGENLVLDLRTVFPRQDKTIVDALLGSTSR